MSSPSTTEPSGAKAERTRATILAAAQDVFSKRGFAAAKLEEVADAVGVTRAALFYYFRDKQALFDAVISDSFGPLADRLRELLKDDRGSVSQRILLATEAWVDAIVARPALSRLILRLVADGAEQLSQGVFADNDQIALRFFSLFEQGRRSGELKPRHEDPIHTASAIIGTSVFYVAAFAMLVPHGRSQPLDAKQAEQHKREALHAARHLLGIAEGDAPPAANN
ncbi:MAG TPA: TetR/AcrR family transcriptional regulator [Nevskiaceae bacterium]|nr:TetR/AcrR family transcriptional regulator [Nevskiaceae bacterium]